MPDTIYLVHSLLVSIECGIFQILYFNIIQKNQDRHQSFDVAHGRYMDADHDGKVSFQDFKDFLSVASTVSSTPAVFMWNPKGNARRAAAAKKHREGRVQFAVAPSEVCVVSSDLKHLQKFGKVGGPASSTTLKLSVDAIDQIHKSITRYTSHNFNLLPMII